MITRERLTYQVIDLFDRAFECTKNSKEVLTDEAKELIRQANDLDAFCLSALVGGQLIGEIPNPRFDYVGWKSYVAAASEAAYRSEH